MLFETEPSGRQSVINCVLSSSTQGIGYEIWNSQAMLLFEIAPALVQDVENNDVVAEGKL